MSRPSIVPVLLLLALAGCAGPAKLAERSHEALERGDLRKAYETARRALDKAPLHSGAREAYGAAATAIAIDYRTRIARTAQVDTVAAAREAVEFRDFRAEVARYPVRIAEDPEDIAIYSALAEGAARSRYAAAEQSLDSGHPKEAYRRFRESEEFDPHYRDVAQRVPATLERALTTVAILPFENQTSVPNLSTTMAERMIQESERRTGSPALFFTRVIDLESVYEGTSLAQLQRMTRDEALRIGRRLGADRVVTGRYTALQVDNDTHDFTVPVFRKQVDKVADGPDRVRWIETPMQVLARERHVSLVMQYEVLDTRDGEVLVAREEPRELFARVVWTDYQPQGDCGAYAFMPADPQDPGREHGRGSEDRWKRTMGSWSLKEFLEKAKAGPARSTWSSRYSKEFSEDTRHYPVFLAVLPAVDDMVLVALHEAEEPVIGTLRELDPED